MKNPFQYGKIAEKNNFIDRDNDRAFLKQSLFSGTNVILVSPRRWGKSSLVKQAMKELCEEQKNVRVCFIDAFPITSSEEFYRTFAHEVLKATASHWQNIMDSAGKFLKTIAPKISFSSDPMNEFSLSFNINGKQENEVEILSLPEKIAKDKGLQIVICIDEFQKLAKFTDYERLENLMRSVWQHQQNTSYCLYGSQRHMMAEIFDSSEKPFYRFGQIYSLKKIEKSEWIKYILDRFKATGKHISMDFADRIVDTVEGHSWYVQQLSSAVWNYTTSQVDDDSFNKALTWCVDVNSESYRNICDSLSETQLNLLKAIANGELRLSSAEVMMNYHLGTSANVTKNKKIFSRTDIINIENAKINFLDPIFKLWFVENYIHGSY